jgi:hypothetical protein
LGALRRLADYEEKKTVNETKKILNLVTLGWVTFIFNSPTRGYLYLMSDGNKDVYPSESVSASDLGSHVGLYMTQVSWHTE